MRSLGVFPLLLLGLGCGPEAEIAAPEPAGDTLPRIAAGDTVSLDLAPGDSAFLIYRPADDALATLFLQSVRASTRVTAHDSGTAALLARGTATPENSVSILNSRTDVFEIRRGAAVRVEVRPSLPGSGSALRLVLHLVDPAPEHRPAAVSIGDTVRGERLETSADVDVFSMSAQAGDEIVLFLQPADSLRRDGISLTLLAGDSSVLRFGNTGQSNDPDSHSSGRLVLTEDGYTLQIAGSALPPSAQFTTAGDYTFELYRVERAPESVASTVTVNDTVAGEAIDRVGGIDEFVIVAPPGDTLNVFFQATAVPDSARLVLALPGTPTPAFNALESGAGQLDLYSLATGAFFVPDSGTVPVRVTGLDDQGSVLHRGAYRFFVYRISAAPEVLPVQVVPGDTVTGETIELPGDLDRFRFSAMAGDTVAVWLDLLGDFTGAFAAVALEDPDGIVLAVRTAFGQGTTSPVGLVTGGEYAVRIGSSSLSGYGSYRFVVTVR